MRNIRISDITLCIPENKTGFTFREKIEAARLLDRLAVSVIELGEMTGGTADTLLIKSVASSVQQAAVAVCPGFDPDTIAAVWEALREAAHPRLQVRGAVSSARMEYVYHKKANGMLEEVPQAVSACKALCPDVEFIAEDATRADTDYLCRLLTAAIEAGATTVTVCDTAGVLLPEECDVLLDDLLVRVPRLREVTLGMQCSDALHVADAVAITALRKGAGEIKVASLPADAASLVGVTRLLTAKADALGVLCPVHTTEMGRVLNSLEKLCNKADGNRTPFENGVRTYPEEMSFSADDTVEAIVKGAEYLGYDLNDTDKMRVWKAFGEIAQRKESVSIGELEAIIASEAMQVPATYTLQNFVITTGNAIDIIAHIKLQRDGKVLDGLSLGDGPIDAAFLAIEQITGHHYEVDDFQIRSITEGREAMGQTIVKLRSNGRVYAGRGISTDIIGSGVSAYINALNKIIYEEENA